jgi:hypothetical protein
VKGLVESFADCHKLLKKCENMDLKVHERFSEIEKNIHGALSANKQIYDQANKLPHKRWDFPQEEPQVIEGFRRHCCHRR